MIKTFTPTYVATKEHAMNTASPYDCSVISSTEAILDLLHNHDLALHHIDGSVTINVRVCCSIARVLHIVILDYQ